MPHRWFAIWSDRQAELRPGSRLTQLLAADGFDSLGAVDETAWLTYVHSMAAKLRLGPEDSVFEVGCGAGAFLYPLYLQGNRVAGLDYSASLVRTALQAMPEAAVSVGEARDLPTQSMFDVVVANGVFLYFPDYDYAAIVLSRMLQIARKSVGLFDLPDLAQRAESLRVRQEALGAAAYERKYAGLDHLYYPRDWFAQILTSLDVTLRVENQSIRGYLHNPYRFNVFIDKQAP